MQKTYFATAAIVGMVNAAPTLHQMLHEPEYFPMLERNELTMINSDNTRSIG